MGWEGRALRVRSLGTPPPHHALVPTPIAGQSTSVAPTLIFRSFSFAMDGPRGLERATKHAKLYLCVAVPAAAAGLSRARSRRPPSRGILWRGSARGTTVAAC